MKNKIILFVLSLFSQISLGQTTGEKLIHGKITSESGNVTGVNIVNLVTEKSTVSDNNGDFYIAAKADDLLVFSSVDLDYYRKLIEETDLKLDLLIIKMTAKVTELQEVVINKHSEINAVSLGISAKGIKKYTPAERRLQEAKSTPIFALINGISGRTEMLKKEVEVEKKELMLVKIDALYKDNYFTKSLKIPKEYINGFKHYIVENEKFTAVLKSKDKTGIEFLMIELAKQYNKIISSEN